MSLNINQERVMFYRNIVKHFGDAVMTKVKEFPKVCDPSSLSKPYPTCREGFSVYYAKLGCMLCIDDRYIACIAENDNHEIGHQRHLSTIPWVSFQTRTIDSLPMKLKDQTLKTVQVESFRDRIGIREKLKDRNVYYAEKTPIKIELLFDKDGSIFSETGTIQSALDTYNCVVTFLI